MTTRRDRRRKSGLVKPGGSQAPAEPRALAAWRPYLWLALVGFVLYARTIGFDITGFDDDVFVRSNFAFNRDITNVFEAFRSSVFVTHPGEYYRPLLTVSFMVNAIFGGDAPGGYHLLNVLLHIASAGLFFRLLTELGYTRSPSFLCSLIYTVHPVLTQAVAWIPGRNDSLLAVFVFLSLIHFVRLWKARHWTSAAWHVVFAGAALFTKESGAAVIVICAAYALLATKHFAGPEGPASIPQRASVGVRQFAGIGLGWLLVGGAWLWLRSLAIAPGYRVSLAEMASRVAANASVTIQYAGKILLPFNLSVFPIKEDTTYIFGALAILLMGGLVLFSKTRRGGPMSFGALFAVVFLIPGLMVPRDSLASPLMEQRLLLPLAGCLVVLLETDLGRRLDVRDAVQRAVVCVGFLVLAGLTYAHTGHFENDETFWSSAVTSSPHSPLAHAMLGEIYRKQERFGDAESELRKSLDLGPNSLMPTINLGLTYLQRNRLDDAERLFTKALGLEIKDEKIRQFIESRLSDVQSARKRRLPPAP